MTLEKRAIIWLDGKILPLDGKMNLVIRINKKINKSKFCAEAKEKRKCISHLYESKETSGPIIMK